METSGPFFCVTRPTYIYGMTGRMLRQMRQRAALTQAEVAEALGLHPNTLARIERGELAVNEPVGRLASILFDGVDPARYLPRRRGPGGGVRSRAEARRGSR